MHVQRHTVTVTTDAAGAATAYTSGLVNGRIFSIKYTKSTFDNGVDFTITTEDTAQNLWVESDVNATATRAPRQPTHDSVGAASLYASGGEPVEGYICAASERIKIVIAQGGNTKTGTFDILAG